MFPCHVLQKMAQDLSYRESYDEEISLSIADLLVIEHDIYVKKSILWNLPFNVMKSVDFTKK